MHAFGDSMRGTWDDEEDAPNTYISMSLASVLLPSDLHAEFLNSKARLAMVSLIYDEQSREFGAEEFNNIGMSAFHTSSEDCTRERLESGSSSIQ